MALKFRLEGLCDGGDALEFHAPSICYGGTSSSNTQSTGSSSSNTTPSNFQNPAFVQNSPYTVSNLNNVVNQGTAADLGGPNFSEFAAPTTNQENSTLGAIGNVLQGSPTGIQNIANQLIPGLIGEGQNPIGFGQNVAGGAPTSALLQAMSSPNYAASLATSPQTKATIQSALQPIEQQFNAQTVPGLEGSFTQAGQRVGTEQGSGSSAFNNAFANAEGSELATEAATAGSISNAAYQTGLQQEFNAGEALYGGNLGEYNSGVNLGANAPGQAASLSSSELGTLVSGLNAQTLPQLTQQLGINQGTQQYNAMMSTILQALGLNTQGAQPSLGYTSTSNSSENSRGSSSGFNISPFGGSSNGSGGFGFSL